MERDLRESPLYREVEEHFRKVYEPGFGRVTEPSDPRPSPDGRWVAFTGSLWRSSRGPEDAGSAWRRRVAKGGAGDGASGAKEVSSGPEHDAGPRWSPDARRSASSPTVGRRAGCSSTSCPSTAWARRSRCPRSRARSKSTRGRPTARGSSSSPPGLHADSAGADGSGALESERDLPDWTPAVDSWEDRQVWRRLWVRRCGVRARSERSHAMISTSGRRTWCGDRAVVAVASEDPGESAWYAAPLVLIDAATGDDRVLAKSDVQFGLPAGAPDGSRVAAIEAPCSDRQLVSGRAVLIDGSAGERPASRDRGRGHHLARMACEREPRLHGPSTRRHVFGEIDATDAATAPRRGRRATASAHGSPPPRCSVKTGSRSSATDSTVRRGRRRRSGGADRTVASFRHEGHDLRSESRRARRAAHVDMRPTALRSTASSWRPPATGRIR